MTRELAPKLEVSRDLSGGVRIKVMDASCMISPSDAIKFFVAGLREAGIDISIVSGRRRGVS
jgi:hypothetical protein